MPSSELKKSLEFILVDDNHIDHFLVKKLLQKEGYQKPVQCFLEADAAIHYLQGLTVVNDMPLLLLLDINMPGMNGFEFLQAFNSLPEKVKEYCRIIMLSSSFSSDDVTRAKACTYVKYYIDKPLTAQKLEAVLQSLGY